MAARFNLTTPRGKLFHQLVKSHCEGQILTDSICRYILTELQYVNISPEDVRHIRHKIERRLRTFRSPSQKLSSFRSRNLQTAPLLCDKSLQTSSHISTNYVRVTPTSPILNRPSIPGPSSNSNSPALNDLFDHL